MRWTPATLNFGPPSEPLDVDDDSATNRTNHSIVFPCMFWGFNVVLNRDVVDTPPFGWNNDWPCEDWPPVLVRPGNTWTTDLKATTYQEIQCRRENAFHPAHLRLASPPVALGKHELSPRYLTFDESTAKTVQEKLGSYPPGAPMEDKARARRLPRLNRGPQKREAKRRSRPFDVLELPIARAVARNRTPRRSPAKRSSRPASPGDDRTPHRANGACPPPDCSR